MTMATTNSTTADEQEIHGLISKWSRALEQKDVDGLTASYAPDVILYDVIPPYRAVGIEAIRNIWSQCLQCFPKQFTSEHHDLRLTVSGDTAFVFGLHHIVPIDNPQHRAGETWMRITVCYQRIDGRWLVVHEHVSVPFDPWTGQVAYIKNPNEA
jgi:uncharacterized protein (TIGR02246 family)